MSQGFIDMNFRSIARTLTSLAENGRRQSRQIGGGGQRWGFTAAHPPMTRVNFMVIEAFVNAQDGEIKILGTGELEKKLVVVAQKFSDAAKQKIEAKGGEAKTVEKKK